MMHCICRHRWTQIALALLLCLCVWPVLAASGMRLDRDRITIDETVTLTITVEGMSVDVLPDPALLTRDFRVVGQSMTQEGELFGPRQRVTLQLVLRPLREGVIELPPLLGGTQSAAPLKVTVLPSERLDPSSQPGESTGQPIFVEVLVDTQTPYVQQTVGYTVRLYHDSGLIPNGRIDVDTPEGASLLRIGDDRMETIQLSGRYYKVIERHYLLVPERAGTLLLAPARFLGRTSNPFDAFFQNDGGEIRVRSKALTLEVKPIPANAPQPWLPLASLSLRYRDQPKAMRAGESAEIVIEVVADGATSPQIADPIIEVGSGAELFADKVERNDRFANGRPQASLVRRFSIVPMRAGRLRVAGPRIAWWDAAAGIERVASLPDLDVPVMAAAASKRARDGQHADERYDEAADDVPRGWRGMLPQGAWLWVLVALPLLWLIALAAAWRATVKRRSGSPDQTARVVPVLAAQVEPSASAQRHADPQSYSKAWASALEQEDLAGLARLLCEMAQPSAPDLDTVRQRLVDPAQRAAVDALQQARWGDGDPGQALDMMRTAFREGPRWRLQETAPHDTLLPPLYPQY